MDSTRPVWFLVPCGPRQFPNKYMWPIARLLILERVRRLGSQHGWAGYLSVCLVLILFGGAAATAAAPAIKGISLDQLGRALSYLWAVWIAMGVLVGKDLSWQIRPERLTLFPTPGFLHIYTLWMTLGFFSVPMLCVLAAFEAVLIRKGTLSPISFLEMLGAFVLFVSSVRLIISLARAALFRSSSLRPAWRVVLFVAMVVVVLGWLAAVLPSNVRFLLPGYQVGTLAFGLDPVGSLFRLGALVIPLALLDFRVQRELAYSGIRGPLASASRLVSRGSLLLLRPAWPGPLFGMALLGWLRNRNALLLLLWGTAYGFFYTWYSKPNESFYFFGFTWMVLIFHSYLRGNLFGMDRGGAWFYYLIPRPVEHSLREKNVSLNAIQALMVAAIFLPSLFHPSSEMNAEAWGRVLTYAVSAIIVGEISGSIFSVLQPEPIERGSHYSGGMTAGALLVPLIQLVFLLVFAILSGLARHFFPAGLFWCVLAAFPIALLAARSLVLPKWVHRIMLQNREEILQRLAVFSS